MNKELATKILGDIRDRVYWQSSNGSMLIKNMETSHIQNIIIYLHERQTKCTELGIGTYKYKEYNAEEWIEIFKNELEFRNTESK